MSTLLSNLTRSLTVGRPWWLILLPLLIVPLILFSYKSLSGLGKVRRLVAILIRTSVVTALGNENRGNAIEQALAAKELGVQVDVLPVDYFYDKEVLVEKVSLPPDVKKGETVNINVVVRASEPTRGTLQVFQKDSDNR